MNALALALVLCAPQESPAQRFSDFPEQDALSYDVRLDVDLRSGQLRGSAVSTWRAEQALDAIRLHSTPPAGEGWSLTFRGVSAETELRSSRDGDVVTVQLPEKVAAGEEVQLRVDFAGRPPDGFYFAKTRHGDPIAFTDHYSIRARGWLPCEDHPADRAKWSLDVTHRRGLEATAYGREVETGAAAGERTRRRFTSDVEVAPYMFSLVVGTFERVAEAGDPRLVDHFVYPQDAEAARGALIHHAGWMKQMEEVFGPYPYAKYTTVQCPTRWGGFEAPGSVQLSESLFGRPGQGIGTLAHELVHMWFGDAVGYARWREVWLSEGFASYFGPWLYATVEGAPSLAQSMASQRQRWRGSFEGRTKTVRDNSFPHPDQALNSNTYPKGAWILHMLRGELGDELFFSALGTYFRECQGRSVVTTDFVDVIEREADRELGWFFSQWLDRVGCPELAVTASKESGLVVEQRQRGAPYRFQLRLRFVDDAGEQDRVVEIQEARVEVATEGLARDLEIDPEVELLFRPAR